MRPGDDRKPCTPSAPGMSEYEIASLLAQGLPGARRRADRQPHRHRRAHSQLPPPHLQREEISNATPCWSCAGAGTGWSSRSPAWCILARCQTRSAPNPTPCAQIDAAMIAATRPGRTLGQVFGDTTGRLCRRRVIPAEWQLHHQGGPAGYEPREYLGPAWQPGRGRRGPGVCLEPIHHRRKDAKIPSWSPRKASRWFRKSRVGLSLRSRLAACLVRRPRFWKFKYSYKLRGCTAQLL